MNKPSLAVLFQRFKSSSANLPDLKPAQWGLIAGLLIFGFILWLSTRPPPLIVQGEVSADRVDISPRVNGRIAKLNADVGDMVERGKVIAVLENPQLAATLLAAKASGAKVERDAGTSLIGSALTAVGGKILAYLLLEAFVLTIYLIVLPYFYGLPRLGSVAAILVFAVPFILAVSSLGLVVAAIFRSPLIVQLAAAAIGLPFFFLAGFAWPAEAMPDVIRVISSLVPSTAAIDGFVRIAQLGAPLALVRSQFLTLWVLALFYGAVALLFEIKRYSRALP